MLRTILGGMAIATVTGAAIGVPAGIVAVKCRTSRAVAAYSPGAVNG